MKLNVRPINQAFLKQPGFFAMSYETLQLNDNSQVISPLRDFNFTIYKDESLIIWLMLCPCPQTLNAVELKQRFLKEGEECVQIEEDILKYAENWARENNFKVIYVYACDVSMPYYNRHDYKLQGQPFYKDGICLYKMVKAL